MKHVQSLLLLAASMAFGAHAAVISGSNTTAFAIPDSNLTGISSTISITGAGLVDSLTVTLAIDHYYVGDLIATLSHGGTTLTLMGAGGDTTNLPAQYSLTFSAAAIQLAGSIGASCSGTFTVGISPCSVDTSFQPLNAFTPFIGGQAAGDWVLKVSDVSNGDTGTLQSWSINLTTAPVPEPSSYALMLGGLGLLALARRRKR